jgi:hypothetical protein
MAIYHPPTFINAYIKDNTNEFNSGTGVPFFPTSPTSIDDLTETFPLIQGTDGAVFAVYDRMLRMRRTPFPHIKSEELMYYFYGTSANSVVNVINVTQKIQDLLDYEDESAQDLNDWIRDKQSSDNPLRDESGEILPSVFFHRLRAFQLQETRDIINFGTARTYAGNKIIIDYDWHKS